MSPNESEAHEAFTLRVVSHREVLGVCGSLLSPVVPSDQKDMGVGPHSLGRPRCVCVAIPRAASPLCAEHPYITDFMRTLPSRPASWVCVFMSLDCEMWLVHRCMNFVFNKQHRISLICRSYWWIFQCVCLSRRKGQILEMGKFWLVGREIKILRHGDSRG